MSEEMERARVNREQIHQAIHNAYKTRKKILSQPHYRGLSSWENQNLSLDQIMELRKLRLSTQVKTLIVNETHYLKPFENADALKLFLAEHGFDSNNWQPEESK